MHLTGDRSRADVFYPDPVTRFTLLPLARTTRGDLCVVEERKIQFKIVKKARRGTSDVPATTMTATALHGFTGQEGEGEGSQRPRTVTQRLDF